MSSSLCTCVLSRVRLFATPWTVAHQAPLSMGFFRQEYWRGFWSGLPFPLPGIETTSSAAPALSGGFFTTEPPWEARPHPRTCGCITLPGKKDLRLHMEIQLLTSCILGTEIILASLVVQMVKNLPAMWENPGSILGSERSPGEVNGCPLRYSCLENFMGRGAWWAQSMGLQRVGHN